MKSIKIFSFIVMIINIACDCDATNSKIVAKDYSVDNCKDANKGDGYCCYYEAPKMTTKPKKGCLSIEKYVYDNIGVYVKYSKTFGGDDGETEDKDAKIDCNSFYLQISTFIIMILLNLF